MMKYPTIHNIEYNFEYINNNFEYIYIYITIITCSNLHNHNYQLSITNHRIMGAKDNVIMLEEDVIGKCSDVQRPKRI